MNSPIFSDSINTQLACHIINHPLPIASDIPLTNIQLLLTSPTLYGSRKKGHRFLKGKPVISSEQKLEKALMEVNPHEKLLGQIALLPNKLLKEQMKQIYEVVIRKKLSVDEISKLLIFCFKLITPRAIGNVNVTFTPLNETLGQILFTESHLSGSIVAKLNIDDLRGSINAIEKTAEEIVTAAYNKLNTSYKFPNLIQSHRRLAGIKLVKELSTLLITSDGIFHTGMIPQIITIFLIHSRTRSFSKHEIHITKQLSHLQRDGNLRALLCSIQKPRHEFAIANDLIRIACDLINTPVNDVDAKRTVLSAFLGHIRQGHSSSCFSVFAAINALASAPHHSLKNLKQLIEDDQLIHIKGTHNMRFPFLMKISPDKSKSEFMLNRRGLIKFAMRGYFPIWKLPGIKAVGKMLSIAKMRSLIVKTIASMNRYDHIDNRLIKTTIQNFLEQLIVIFKASNPQNQESIKSLLDRATFAYFSQTEHPLLSAWVNAIASMVDIDHDSGEKRKISHAIIEPLHEFSLESGLKRTHFHLDWLEIASRIQKICAKRLYIQFDPSLSRTHLMHPETTHGGFVVYDRNFTSDSQKWIRIDNASAFQELVIRIVNQAVRTLRGSLSNTKGVDAPLLSFISSQKFLLKALLHYEKPSILSKVDAKPSINNLKCYPWVRHSGGNARAVLSNLIQAPTPLLPILSFTPKSAMHLLQTIIDVGKNSYRETYFCSNKPVIIHNTHALSLIINHPSMQRALISPLRTDIWIRRNIIQPGQAISNTLIQESVKKDLIFYSAANFIEPKHKQTFIEQIKTTLNQPLTIQAFRMRLVKVTINWSKKELKHHQISSKLDLFIFNQGLSGKERKMLYESAIHICDTNWSEEGLDVHFCALFNPGLGELQIWKVLENQTKTRVMNNTKWVTKAIWDIFPAYSDLNLEPVVIK